MHRLAPALALALLAPAAAGAGIDARMLRYPDVSAERIAFVYAGDIWTVDKAGGVAQRLSTPAGEELFPRFSPDGSEIAFSAEYDGNRDVYVLPVAGGVPERLTHHPASDRLVDWTPDGSGLLVASFRTSEKDRFDKLYRVDRGGGLPERLPMAYGESGALSPDGGRIAYLFQDRSQRTWKRYRGGWAPDIWLFDLGDLSSRNLTRTDANEGSPMWHGDTLYFLSDRGPHQRANLWAMEVDGGEARQLTRYREMDVHLPALGPEEIVFEVGGRLHLFDLASEEVRPVDVEAVTDLTTLKPRPERVADLVRTWDVSPSGKRAVFEARGEIFTVPAEHGPVLDLTRTSGVAERHPAWSPDGSRIAYFTDASGEYELAVRPADGRGGEERLTELGPGFRYRLSWSPDSRKLVWVDQAMRIQLYDLDRGEVVEVDRGLYLYEDSLRDFRVSWSADSRWFAWDRSLESLASAVFVYDTREGERHQVTSGFYSARQPVFDPGGSYLYLLWSRTFEPIYDDFQSTWVYADATRLAALPLTADVASPLAPRNDEEGEEADAEEDEEEDGESGEAGEEEEEGDDGDGEGDEPSPVEIDLAGLESRLVVLPPAAGAYDRLQAAEGKLLYLRRPRAGTVAAEGPASEVLAWDLEEREEESLVAAADDFVVAAGGEKMLVRAGEAFAIVDVAPEQELEKELRIAEMETVVDPREEWRQLFREAWRIERDYFYDPGMHGVDWAAIGERYRALLPFAVTRWDVNYLIGEMLGELNASHAYRGGGDEERAERRGTGLLGVDFELADGAYRIADIVDVAPWETEVRSPLRQPGVDVEEGAYVLAVNGRPLDPAVSPWAPFAGLAGETVVLTVNDRPTREGAREVLVETLESEHRLRNLAWIEAKRRRVAEATDGRVGYVYVPSTALDGQNELVRQFLPQIRTEGLIVDERFNNGGQIPDRFVELLDRPLTNYWATRDGPDWEWPLVAHHGPKAMLINGWSGSGGDLFPFYFRAAGLGPLIGTRTWGGLIGISGGPALIDGGRVTAPSFAIYSTDGEWIVEGHGVEPDIEVVEDPTALAGGVDNQLEAAIEEMLRLLEERPWVRPDRPAPADRSGS